MSSYKLTCLKNGEIIECDMYYIYQSFILPSIIFRCDNINYSIRYWKDIAFIILNRNKKNNSGMLIIYRKNDKILR